MRYYVAAFQKIAIALGAQLNCLSHEDPGHEGFVGGYGLPSRSMADCKGASETRTSPM